MCFGGGGGQTVEQEAPAPAPAPAPPAPLAEQVDVRKPSQTADVANYGTSTPDLRIDRSVSSGGVASGGAGLKM